MNDDIRLFRRVCIVEQLSLTRARTISTTRPDLLARRIFHSKETEKKVMIVGYHDSELEAMSLLLSKAGRCRVTS